MITAIAAAVVVGAAVGWALAELVDIFATRPVAVRDVDGRWRSVR